ncbi:MAG: GntR family transcriptional regulator [Solirubrobacteraceae bacterium]|nr:GntR family transcriptional regulator [Solirubrobacteraceae bacterium]
MSVQRASPAEQIANELRARIDDGRYKPGDTIPGDATLAAEFGVSKPTVTKARAMLVALGLIKSRPGTPSFITEPAVTFSDLDASKIPTSSWPRVTRTLPLGEQTRVVEADLRRLPADLADAFGTDRQDDVVVRRTVTVDPDDTPLMSSVSYFPGELVDTCPLLLKTKLLLGGAPMYIGSQTGRIPASTKTTVACSPTRDHRTAADDLGLGSRAYLLSVTTTTSDRDGQLIAHEITCHPPGTPVDLDVVADPWAG